MYLYLAAAGGCFLLAGVVLWHHLRTPSPRGGRPLSEAGASNTSVGEGALTFDGRRALEELDALLEAVEEGDWARARAHFSEFERIARALPSPGLTHPDVSFALMDFFHLYRVQLERALSTEDSAGAMFAGNQLGDIIWDLRVQLGRAPLPELGRLRYLERDLRYWSEMGDEQMIRARVRGLERAWTSLRPVVASGRGRELVERFDELLEQLRAAHAVEEYREIAPELEEVVQQVEAHFSERGVR